LHPVDDLYQTELVFEQTNHLINIVVYELVVLYKLFLLAILFEAIIMN